MKKEILKLALAFLFTFTIASSVRSEDEAPPAETAATEAAPTEAAPAEATAQDPGAPPEVSEAVNDEVPAEENPVSTESALQASQSAEGEPPADTSNAEDKPKANGIARLLKKLHRKDGSNAPIGVLTPLDYTTLNFADVAQESILASIARYGEFDLRSIVYSPASLTLEEFRKVVTKYKVDVVILTVMKPTNFDMFLYDRRTPYHIYAHSETLPEELQYQISQEVVQEYAKIIVRRTLYSYMQDQYYELPREDSRPLLNAEVPRWVASSRNLAMVNRELLSKFYASVSVGAALSTSNAGLWNSNLIGLQGAMRIVDNFYLEAGLDMFSYNALSVSMKYHFGGKELPFRFLVGLGGAMLMNKYTLNWDQTFGQGLGGIYVVPSGAFMLPIVDVHFKVEFKAYLDPSFSKGVFVLMPGIFVLF